MYEISTDAYSIYFYFYLLITTLVLHAILSIKGSNKIKARFLKHFHKRNPTLISKINSFRILPVTFKFHYYYIS